MGEYLPDDVGIFDAGDDLHGSAAGVASSDIDVEHALEALRPGHGGMAFGGCGACECVGGFGFASLASAGRRDQCPVIAVGCEHTMKTSKVDAGLGNQRSEPGDEIQRFEDHVGGASTPVVTLSDVVASRLSAF